MTHSCLKNAAVPVTLAMLLLAGGCKRNNTQQQSSNDPAQYPPAQSGQQQQQQQQQPYSQQQPYGPQQGSNSGSGAPGRMPPPPPRERASERGQTDRAYGNERQPYANGQPAQGAYAPPAAVRQPATIPAGTHIVVSLGQEISSKTSQPGDSFTATVAEPVVVGGATLIRAGAPATGTVVDAKSLGRFKGQAELAIRLDSVRAEGRSYRVASSTVDRVEKGKGRRTAEITGGGGGLGALIGGLAGGGKGALIGGLLGAGAGGAGSAFTGNKELVIPAETQLTFRLERDVPLQ